MQPYGQAAPSDVWPPPVYGNGNVAPQTFHPFTFLYARVEGSVADIREGKLAVDQGGIIIDGRAIPRAEIYQTILIIALFLRGLVVIAYLIMRYACLRNEMLAIPWSQIQNIALEPKRRKLCVTYRAPNYKGDIKTFGLTMQFKQAAYDEIVNSLGSHAPGLAQPGKIRAANSPVVVVWASIFFLALIALLVGEVAGQGVRFTF